MTVMDLTGRRILVVGASSGIGRSVALAAAEAGAEIVAVGRRKELLDAVVSEAGSGTALAVDVCSAEGRERIERAAADVLGSSVDAALHCVGASQLLPISETPLQAWDDAFATNVTAPCLITSALLPHLVPGAVVAFLSSRSVGRPYHGVGAYAASKAALDQAILSWRLEHREHRFLRIEVGDTTGTDFGRSFDERRVAQLLPLWATHAALSEHMMDCGDLGAVIVQLLAVTLGHPQVAMRDLVLHPPGGPMTEGIQEFLDNMREAYASRGIGSPQ